MGKLRTIINILLNGDLVPEKYYVHPLSGDMTGYMELHIEDDWLLVYKVDPPLLKLYRTGRHKDIFS